MPFKYISRQNIKGKTLVVRACLNSPVENKRLVVSSRIRAQAESIRLLSSKGAKLVLLAHQGRKGKEDFISLEQHAKALAKLSGKKITFVSWKEDFQKIIKDASQASVILMDNTRFQPDETEDKPSKEHAKSSWVKKIASVSDFFVENAFADCHRSHASVVGFSSLLPGFAGPDLEKELSAIEKISESNTLFILGGAKISDSLGLIEFLLKNKKAESICIAGLLGELFLKAKGINLGAKEKFFEEKKLNGLVPDAKKILGKFSSEIALPLDIAVDSGKREEISVKELPSSFPIKDIGSHAIEKIKEKISEAGSVVFNGPLGVYEESAFAKATREIFSLLKKRDKCIIGGGDTETALHSLGFSQKDFFHVSLAGKALLEFLAEKELPGLKVLEK